MTATTQQAGWVTDVSEASWCSLPAARHLYFNTYNVFNNVEWAGYYTTFYPGGSSTGSGSSVMTFGAVPKNTW